MDLGEEELVEAVDLGPGGKGGRGVAAFRLESSDLPKGLGNQRVVARGFGCGARFMVGDEGVEGPVGVAGAMGDSQFGERSARVIGRRRAVADRFRPMEGLQGFAGGLEDEVDLFPEGAFLGWAQGFEGFFEGVFFRGKPNRVPHHLRLESHGVDLSDPLGRVGRAVGGFPAADGVEGGLGLARKVGQHDLLGPKRGVRVDPECRVDQGAGPIVFVELDPQGAEPEHEIAGVAAVGGELLGGFGSPAGFVGIVAGLVNFGNADRRLRFDAGIEGSLLRPLVHRERRDPHSGAAQGIPALDHGPGGHVVLQNVSLGGGRGGLGLARKRKQQSTDPQQPKPQRAPF